MPTAVCMIRSLPHYRRDAFDQGLARAGYDVVSMSKKPPEPGDLLVIWNRYQHFDYFAKQFEKAGAAVIVVENGWLGREKHFAIARSHHNGAGGWAVGDESRWLALDIPLQPWRSAGEHILLLPQRGIGPPGVAMPLQWTASAYARLKKITGRPIRVRPHPGTNPVPLEPDFENCWAAVTWGSGAAIQAIVAGIPVFYELEPWIGGPAATYGIENIEEPFLGDRRPMLERLAWAQWTAAEVSSGEPFRWLLT